MKISEYLKSKAIEKICEENSYDLKTIKLSIMSDCNLSKGFDLSRCMKPFKKFIADMADKKTDKIRMKELMRKLYGEYNNQNWERTDKNEVQK